jgi:hypothetical protein
MAWCLVNNRDAFTFTLPSLMYILSLLFIAAIATTAATNITTASSSRSSSSELRISQCLSFSGNAIKCVASLCLSFHETRQSSTALHSPGN